MNPIVRKSLTFGSIAGGVCFLFFLVMYFLNPNPLALRRPDLGINIIFIGVAIWYYKRENGGYLHFYEGFSLGFLTNIIAALLTGVLIFLFLQYVDVRPFEEWTAWSKNLLLTDRERSKELMNEQTFQQLLKSFEEKSPAVIIGDELIFKQIAIVACTLFSMGMRKIKP